MPDAERCADAPKVTSAEGAVIGLVNNMPDAAIRSAERQIRNLLLASSPDLPFKLRLFYSPEVPRSEIARTSFLQSYEKIANLWDARLDGLIVTGAEPHAETLTDEPYWPTLSRLVDWAAVNTVSTIWSCMACHAAVYKLSGVERKLLPYKLSGLFECQKAMEHPLTEGVPRSWYIPHSRYNDLPETELVSLGFKPLTTLRSGLDTFVFENRSLFVFFQGHPEYDSESLLLEYIRDVKRFIEGEREEYPEAPAGYFQDDMLERLERLRAQALVKRDRNSFTDVTRLLQRYRIENVWRTPSTSIFRNWVRLLYAGKRDKENRAEGELDPGAVAA